MLRLLRGYLIVALILSVLLSLDFFNEDPAYAVPQVRFLTYLMGFTECYWFCFMFCSDEIPYRNKYWAIIIDVRMIL